MTRPSPARDEIMLRIRSALAGVAAGPNLPWEMGTDTPAPPEIGEDQDMDRRIARFREMLERVGGHFHLAASSIDATEVVRKIAREGGVRRILHSDDRRVLQRASTLAEEFECVPHSEERGELLTCDLGLTSSQWGIAETGTVVLESAAEHHRLASLLPPVHVVMLDVHRLLPTLDDLLAEVKHDDLESMSRTITMITGPSRTADIELTLVVGVHGPRELHVILLQDLEENQP